MGYQGTSQAINRDINILVESLKDDPDACISWPTDKEMAGLIARTNHSILCWICTMYGVLLMDAKLQSKPARIVMGKLHITMATQPCCGKCPPCRYKGSISICNIKCSWNNTSLSPTEGTTFLYISCSC